MVYQWKAGSRISVNAQVAGEVCNKLEQQHRLTAVDLLNESRPESAPLHNAFEWDDSIAGEEWRKHQARHIINSLIVSKEELPSKTVRCFFNFQQSGEYKSINTIIKSEDDTAALMEKALSELDAFRRKYEALKQLDSIFELIESFERKYTYGHGETVPVQLNV